MNGQMNSSLNSTNAAFSKIKALDKKVTTLEVGAVELKADVENIKTEVNAIETNIATQLETATATIGNLDVKESALFENGLTVDGENLVVIKDIQAANISADVADISRIPNAEEINSARLYVSDSILTNVKSNELNVETTTNLKNQVNIEGDLLFTKDKAKIQGNCLEIDTAQIVIDNKNSSEYALYVPGEDGDALFGGSVAVQDTLATKNLMVTGETYFKDGIVLNSPTLGNIPDGGYSTTALDVDSRGKVVKVKLAAELPGSASALVDNATRYTSELNPIIQCDTDENIPFVFQVDTNTFLPTAYEEGTEMPLAAIPNGDTADVYSVCSHLDNVYYPKGSEYLKYNFTTGTTTVVAQIDENKSYFTMTILGGKVLDEDIPAYWCAEDNKMYSLLDGSELEVSFTLGPDSGGMTVYADKNRKTYVNILSTDTKFNSILDEGQGVLFEVPGNDKGDGEGYAVDCPAIILDTGTGKAAPFNGGHPVDVEKSLLLLYRLVKDNTYLAAAIGVIYTYNVGAAGPEQHPSLIYNYGFFNGFEYITTVPYTEKLLEVSTENVFIAKDTPVEINGKYFVDGRWYDKVVTSYEEFMQFIVDTENNYVAKNNYPKYFDVLYNNAGSEVIPNNPWNTADDGLKRSAKHFYRLIGLRSNMNGDGYFGSDSMTDNGVIGEVRDIQSIFTLKHNFDFFAPPASIRGKLLYENIEFSYVNGFFSSPTVTDLKNCNIFIEGQWTNAAGRVAFEHCEDVYFTARDIDFATGETSYYDFNGCNGMFVDTLIGYFQPNITINYSTMLMIRCTSQSVTQHGPGDNAHYVVTGRKEITLE